MKYRQSKGNSLEDLRALEALENKLDLEDAKKAIHDIEKHGTVSWEDTKRELSRSAYKALKDIP